MLSKKARYALHALAFLFRHAHQEYTGIVDISVQEKIPRKFLEAILLELKTHDILLSKRGKGGGYTLSKQAETITVGQVIRLMDGTLALTPCASRTSFKPCEVCKDPEACSIRPLMVKVREATAEILDQANLKDIIDKHSELLYII